MKPRARGAGTLPPDCRGKGTEDRAEGRESATVMPLGDRVVRRLKQRPGPKEHRGGTYLPLQRMEPLVPQVAVGSLQRENRTQGPVTEAAFHRPAPEPSLSDRLRSVTPTTLTGIHTLNPLDTKPK